MSWHEAVGDGRAIGALPEVGGIAVDSRRLQRGWAFVAVPGAATDGHAFLQAAVEAGAAVAVVQADREALWAPFAERLPLLVVPDTRAAAGPLAAAVYGHPSRHLLLAGVTGTNGKSTTSHLAAHVLSRCGTAAGYLTSIGFETGDGFVANDLHMTTLEAPAVQSLLAQGVAAGRRAMVVEASSEGLAQRRLHGCDFDVAVFTNLTRDHLDFHGTMESYLAAKGLLFEMTAGGSDKGFAKAAIVNGDDPASEYIAGLTGLPLLRFGIGEANDLRARDIETAGTGMRFTVAFRGEALPAELPLLGRFNVANALAAVAVALSQGVRLSEALEALAGFAGVPGRLERIECDRPYDVFVDFASTPDALENALTALRAATRNRLWVVFGAAGGRDPARRDGMGRVAGRLADRAVITNEDPRYEDPNAIIEAIAAGLRETGRQEGRDFHRIPDRREAIAFALEQAGDGDVVVFAGKATETTMIFGDEHRPWNERAVVRELLGLNPSA